jgi:hypothetical protein
LRCLGPENNSTISGSDLRPRARGNRATAAKRRMLSAAHRIIGSAANLLQKPP